MPIRAEAVDGRRSYQKILKDTTLGAQTQECPQDCTEIKVIVCGQQPIDYSPYRFVLKGYCAISCELTGDGPNKRCPLCPVEVWVLKNNPISIRGLSIDTAEAQSWLAT